MSISVPSQDRLQNIYNLSGSAASRPIIYYVNGIQTDEVGHASIAALLSVLTEYPVRGIYNATGGLSKIGMAQDLLQCLLDYTQNATARAASFGLTPSRSIAEKDLPAEVDKLIRQSIVWNKATAQLFKDLAVNRDTMKFIVAHSQGNLVTSNALFVLENFLGSIALEKVRVYSLASPSPGWPLGLRWTNGGGGRQENAFMDDLVALLRPHNLAARVGIDHFQNAGDFRTHGPKIGIEAHDVHLNMALNFLQSIRDDLGFVNKVDATFLEKCRQISEGHFPQLRK